MRHIPVLVNEIVNLMPKNADSIMDGTLGHGGHTEAILQRLKYISEKKGSEIRYKIVGVDRDLEMITKSKDFIGKLGLSDNVYYIHDSYANFENIVHKCGIQYFDYILIDIGVNIEHFKDPERGFSMKSDGPLDMRYDRNQGISAKEWLQNATYSQIFDMLQDYADFSKKFSHWIATEIQKSKRKQKFSTTGSLRSRAKKLGISDKTLAVIFQSLRIVVNRELDELKIFLNDFYKYLKPGGRCVVLTYHSGEDRMVKYAFRDLTKKGVGFLVNKRVMKPGRNEIKNNKASRSAKLRCFEKSKQNF